MHSRSFRATRFCVLVIATLLAVMLSAGSGIAATSQGLVQGTLSGGGGSSASPTQRLLAGVGMTAGPWGANAAQTLLSGGVAVLAVLADSGHVFDGGPPGVTINPPSGLTTTEVGGTAGFSAVLTGAPTANVTIALASSDTSEGTVSPSALTFTPVNSSQPQTAVVTGVADTDIDGTVGYTIITNATSADLRYQGIAVTDVAVTNLDKASQAITFGAAPTIALGGSGIVTATGGASGNPVTFASQTTGVCTITGAAVTGVTAGTCTIAADQAGSANFNVAAQVTQSFAITQPSAWLRPATSTVRIGEALTLDLRLDSRGLKVGAYTFRLTFDPSRLQVDTTQGDQGVSRGSVGIATNIVNTNNGTGVIQLTGFDLTGSGPGADLQFLVIHFVARQVTGSTDIALQVTTLADPTGLSIGTVARGARVEVVAVLCGDANGDNQLSIIDALWIARQVAGLAPTPYEPLGAEVTGDGQVTIIDALMIARRVAGLSVSGGCLAAVQSQASVVAVPTLSAGLDGSAVRAAAGSGGTLSLVPAQLRAEAGAQKVLAVQVDSGSARVGAYTLEIGFDPSLVQVDTAAGGDQGVSPGANGLGTNVVNVDNAQGRLVVTGFDVTGKGPGTNLHLLTIYLRTKGALGTAPLALSVSTLGDELGQTIGTPSAQGSEMIISDNCPLVANPNQADADHDGIGDVCDATPRFCLECLPSRGGWRAILH